MAEYTERRKLINALNDLDKSLFNIINSSICQWDPIDAICCGDIQEDYEWSTWECFKLIKEGKDISKFFNEEYFEINSVSDIKQEMFDGVKADLYRKIMNEHG